jgi:hypothetical protein
MLFDGCWASSLQEDEKEIEIEINNIDSATLMMLNDFAVKCIEKKGAAGGGAGVTVTQSGGGPTKKSNAKP